MARDGGIGSFQKKMKALPEAVRKAVAPATLKGAEEIADAAHHLAPELTGDLAGSIAVTPGGQQTPPYSHPGGSFTVPEGAAAVTVGNTDVRYPHLVEYGTRKMEAQPFFWPAVRSMKKRATNRVKRAMAKAIKDEWKK